MHFGKLYDKYQEDYKGLSKKKKKEKFLIDFEDEWLDILLVYFDIEYPNHNTYLLKRKRNKTSFTYYPGSDKIQIHHNCTYREEGLKFLLKGL